MEKMELKVNSTYDIYDDYKLTIGEYENPLNGRTMIYFEIKYLIENRKFVYREEEIYTDKWGYYRMIVNDIDVKLIIDPEKFSNNSEVYIKVYKIEKPLGI